MRQTDEPVVVATFTGMGEASVARGALEQEGIETFLANEHLVSIAWQLSQATGGVRLSVAASDVERARRILAVGARPLAVVPEQDGNPGAGDAADEEEVSPGPADALIERAWKSSLVGFLAVPPLFHLWALWCLRRAYAEGGPRTERGRTLARRTLLLSTCAATMFVALYAGILLR
jgi:Putative prokaryotic signal transducing protein